MRFVSFEIKKTFRNYQSIRLISENWPTISKMTFYLIIIWVSWQLCSYHFFEVEIRIHSNQFLINVYTRTLPYTWFPSIVSSSSTWRHSCWWTLLMSKPPANLATTNAPAIYNYLKLQDIDVGDQVPLGISALAVAVESQSGCVANGIRQKPRVVILHTRDRRRHNNEQRLPQQRRRLNKFIIWWKQILIIITAILENFDYFGSVSINYWFNLKDSEELFNFLGFGGICKRNF